jgi:hypothetical protein
LVIVSLFPLALVITQYFSKLLVIARYSVSKTGHNLGTGKFFYPAASVVSKRGVDGNQKGGTLSSRRERAAIVILLMVVDPH